MRTRRVKNFSCENCSQVFRLETEHIQKQWVTRLGERELVRENFILLTIVKCPQCSKEYVVQVDNTQTNEKVRELITLMNRQAVYASKGQRLGRKQSKRLLELNKQIDIERKMLQSQFQDQEVECRQYCGDASFQLGRKVIKIDFYNGMRDEEETEETKH